METNQMTLIVTHISKHGIIHASDSNLTSAANAAAGQGRKTFPLAHLNAGMTVAGSYSVGRQPMDQWLDAFIQAHAASGEMSLSSFSRSIKNRLEGEMLPDEKGRGSILHIAGYVVEGGRSHPEFYFVRNVHGIDPTTGAYTDLRPDFACGEDFWSRDCPQNKLLERFERGDYQIYINGFPEGRMANLAVQGLLQEFFAAVWQHPDWRFRPPSSLDEAIVFVRTYMLIIHGLFEVSDYPAPLVGGQVQTYGIPRPANTVTG
jgi:hypothetical protein